MYNKSTQNNATTNQQQLSAVGKYNQYVADYIQQNPLNYITQLTIKQFDDSAQRRKLSVAQYNKEVEIFNNSNGFLILKKGKNYEENQKYYNYINYPYLDREAYKQTMANYRKYVDFYNKEADKYNKEITKYNTKVSSKESKKYLKEVSLFKYQNFKEFTKVYNKEVEEYNLSKGKNIIKKRRLQKVKYQHELTMQILLGFYVKQLKNLNLYKLETNQPTSVLKNKLPRLKVDHRKLSTHKIDGIIRLDYCKKTAQNHIKRLREAGVLTNYLFINHLKPISININPKILVILDGKTPKPQFTKNQPLNQSIEKKLHNNNDTTSNILLKEKEIKDFPNGKFNESGSMLQSVKTECLADSYKSTTEINNKKNKLGRAEIVQILPDFLKKEPVKQTKNELLTNNFRQRLLDDKVLAKELSEGKYFKYSGLDYAYLEKIEMYTSGFLSNQEFKKVIIQDFIKSASKIWINHNVYEGEWKKTINYLNTELFKNITHKETLIKKLREYRWKLNFARQWFQKNKVNALYPYKYFDCTRKKSFEIGFFGLHSVWKTHLKYLENKDQQAKQQKIDAEARKREHQNSKKLDRALKKYNTGTYTLDQLYNYVQDNLPHTYLAQLASLITNNTNYRS